VGVGRPPARRAPRARALLPRARRHLMFARFVPPLRRSAAEVTTWAQPALLPLLATMRGVARSRRCTTARPTWRTTSTSR
jgi:hypothetical protein